MLKMIFLRRSNRSGLPHYRLWN